MANKINKKSMGLIIALSSAILIGAVILTIAIVSIIKENGGVGKKEDTSAYSYAGVTNPTKEDSGNDYFDVETNEDGDVVAHNHDGSNDGGFIDFDEGEKTEPSSKVNQNPNSDSKPKDDPIQKYESLSKNGDNQLSDHHNNKYIKLVSEKHNVDSELLVAIYSEPDTGNNFVLEFNGKRDEDGNVIKSPDTLAKVYQIDKNKKISVATGKTTGNIGVSYAEGTLCFNMVKTIIMPQYPEYFTGVE